MSQENVELTRRLVDAFNRRDVDTAASLMHEKGAWYPALEALAEGRRTYRGPSGTREYYRDLAEFAEESRIECSEVHDLGDQVLVLGRLWMKFASGVELDHESAALFMWQNGKCVETRAWLSHAEALEAVGLSEQDAHRT